MPWIENFTDPKYCNIDVRWIKNVGKNKVMGMVMESHAQRLIIMGFMDYLHLNYHEGRDILVPRDNRQYYSNRS